MPPRWETPEVTLLAAVDRADRDAAAAFGVPVVAERRPAGWQLERVEGRLQLTGPGDNGLLQMDLRLTDGPLAQRLHSARKTDPLPRAVGLPKRQEAPWVVDATAGLGRDALVLAQLGCRVTAVERIPAFCLLLADAARQGGLADRLQVVCADAIGWLQAVPPAAAPAVVYLDPMFDAHGKAQVKKDMQVCRALAGPPEDLLPLLQAACAVASERVVVKRHPDLPPLQPGVSFAIGGERVRFDVYLRPR